MFVMNALCAELVEKLKNKFVFIDGFSLGVITSVKILSA